MPLPSFKSIKGSIKKSKPELTTIHIAGKTLEIFNRFRHESKIADLLCHGRIPTAILKDDHPNYIRISGSDNNKISYLPDKKINDFVKSFSSSKDRKLTEKHIPKSSLFKAKGRVKIKYGSFVNKIFKDVEAKEVEKFATLLRTEINKPDFIFKIVSGDEITRYYHGKQHASSRGTLGISCMRHGHCQPYFKFYADNEEIKMLVMLNHSKAVIGRALLWHLNEDNNVTTEDGKDFKFMDRIYTNNDDNMNHFFKWAQKNGYVYKEKQSWNIPQRFKKNDKDIFTKKMKIKLSHPPKDYSFNNGGGGIPYLDTFKWVDFETGYVYNYRPSKEEANTRNIYLPVSTYGDAFNFNYIKEDTYHKEYWYEEEIKRVKYLKEYVCKRYLYYSKIHGDYILKSHSKYDDVLNDNIFNEEYDKYNNHELIEATKEKIREKEQQRLKKIKEEVLASLPYFDKFVAASVDFFNGNVDYIQPNYSEI